MHDFYVIVAIIGAMCSFVMLFVNTFSSSDVQLMDLRDRGDVVSPMKFPLKETHKPYLFDD